MTKIIAAGLIALISLAAYAQHKDPAWEAYSRGDYKTALSLLQVKADKGNGDALGNIADMYAFGLGVPQNDVIALSYWRRAAEKHVPSAFGNIATCYHLGKCGVPVDHKTASEWYIQAAEHRHVLSMVTLSGLYYFGVGVDKDRVRALAWASLAASNAPNEEIKFMSYQTLKQAIDGATQAQLQQAKELSDQLVPTINRNVALYKSNGL